MQQNKRPAHLHFLLFFSLSLAVFMVTLDYSIANISIPYIAGALSVNNDQGIYVITSFAVGGSIGLASSGYLATRFGEVRVVIISILLLSFFSFACGCSINFTMLIIFRFIQGLVSGPVVPLSQSLIIQNTSKEKRAVAFSILTTIIVVGPVIGPILGGYISDWYQWRWIFYINIPIGILAAGAIWSILHKEESKTERVPFDLIGLLFLTCTITCLQIFLDKGQQWDWFRSPLILSLMAGFLISLILFFIRTFSCAHPFFDLKILKIGSFSIAMIILALSYAITFGTLVLIPFWLHQYMEYNSEWAGITVSALGLAPLCFALITPLLIRHFGNMRVVVLSLLFFTLGSFISTLSTFQISAQQIAFARFIFGFGFICYITPLISMALEKVSTAELPQAMGMYQFVRALSGGIGTSLFFTLWQRRTIFHHDRISSMLTQFNPITPQLQNSVSKTLLNRSLDQQAAILALNEVFYLMGFLLIGVILLLLGWMLYQKIKLSRNPQTTHL